MGANATMGIRTTMRALARNKASKSALASKKCLGNEERRGLEDHPRLGSICRELLLIQLSGLQLCERALCIE